MFKSSYSLVETLKKFVESVNLIKSNQIDSSFFLLIILENNIKK